MKRRLLVIRFGALGDLIHASPSLEAVKLAYPDMEVHLLTSSGYTALAGLLPGVDQVWTWEKKQGWLALFKLAWRWRQIGITDVVNLHPSFKSLLITGLLWPVNAAVYRKQKLATKGAAQRIQARRHAAQDFFQPFQKVLGLSVPQSLLPVLKKTVLDSGDGPVKPEGERWVAIIPGVGAKRSNRAWLPAYYVALMQALLTEQPTLKLLLIGGPDESVLAEQLGAALGTGADRVENHCGQHDISGTAALLAQCDLVVGGDTGPMHLAAAVGISVLGIYGPTALARTGPLAHGPAVLLTPPDALACWPCELPECPYTGEAHLACMKQISVPTVTEAALALLPT
ncbi:glycosyltransferase family 9 protein [Vampirovibrio sp.]|uniref:glycosyltransferase family 9 protein n=1 Tax=Vampirovibrio sp. TaxID=2717857 RepID=UPI0035947782